MPQPERPRIPALGIHPLDGAKALSGNKLISDGLLKSNHSFDAELHFRNYGASEGRLPSLQFDLHYVYHHLGRLVDVDLSHANTIRVFFDLPASERFVPNPWFNPWSFTQLYLERFPEIGRLNNYELFVFYIDNVAAERLSSNGLFSEEDYCAAHPDVAAAIAAGRLASGFAHFVGQSEPFLAGTLPDFDAEQLSPANAIMAEADFVRSDHAEIGNRLWWFDENFYLTVYPDVHALKRIGVIRSGLEHFTVLGDRQGRLAHPALSSLAARPPGIPLRTALTAMARLTSRRVSLGVAVATANILYRQPNTAPRANIDEALWRSVEPPLVRCTLDTDAYRRANPDLAHYPTEQSLIEHWRAFGLREQRLTPGTNLFGQRRLQLEHLGLWLCGGVNLIGAMSAHTGLGAAARGYRDAMLASGITVDQYDVSGATRPGGVFDLIDPERMRFGHNFICLNPDHIATLIDRYGSALMDQRVNIGAWVWEMPVARPEWNAVLSGFDLIVTPSEFCKQAFAAVTERAIEVVPYVVDRDALLAERAKFRSSPWIDKIEAKRVRGRSLPPRTVVLFVMDASSYPARKGIDIFRAVAARIAAAAPGEFLFVVKTHSLAAKGDQLGELPRDTMVIDAVLSGPDLVTLKSLADVYFSPHRGEGFGLNIFESLVLGVPALVSDYAGAGELLGADYPLLIPGRTVEVGAELGPYRTHAVWFEPDIEPIVARLLAFPKRDAAARAAMATLCHDLAKHLSAEAIGRSLRGIFERRCAFGLDVSGFLKVIASSRDESIALPHVNARHAGLLHVAEDLVRPHFSVITPTYNTKPEWLEDIYADLCAQSISAWEWCIADDGSTEPATLARLTDLRKRDTRIRVIAGERNEGISAATNRAVMLSVAPYVVMVDHDDRLAPDLLAAYQRCIAEAAPPDLVYCDEDKILPDGTWGDHYYKPDYAPEHLMSVMYVLHCLCIRKAKFLELGGYRSAYDGAQDHDFVLRAASADAKFGHVAASLYHWRMIPRSTAATPQAKPQAEDAGRRAVADHLERLGVAGTVEPGAFTGSYRVRPRLPDEPVTLLILTRFTKGQLGGRPVCYAEHFIDSILKSEPGAEFRLTLVIDEGGEANAERLAKRDRRIAVLLHRRGDAPFNFAAKANFAVASAATERVVLLNDDMAVLDDGWLAALLEPLELPGVGITGGRLLYADDTVQHAGIVLGLQGAAGHIFGGTAEDYIGYNGFTHVMRNYAAVTGAFMAFRRSLFDRLGGFDERYPIDYNDVDFCLRGLEAGIRVVYTPFARLRHFESRSAPRHAADRLDTERFSHRWRAMIECDPYYNPNLSRYSNLCLAA